MSLQDSGPDNSCLWRYRLSFCLQGQGRQLSCESFISRFQADPEEGQKCSPCVSCFLFNSKNQYSTEAYLGGSLPGAPTARTQMVAATSAAPKPSRWPFLASGSLMCAVEDLRGTLCMSPVLFSAERICSQSSGP